MIPRPSWTVAGVVLLAAVCASATIPGPAEVLGIQVGADRVLVSADETERYMRALATASDRVSLVDIGRSVAGRALLALVISTPEHIQGLADLRRQWADIADPRHLDAQQRAAILQDLPSCALITAGIHSTEVAGTSAALLFAHQLAAAPAGSPLSSWLQHTVVVVVPSLNPDGQDMVAQWYRRWLGTPHEGSSPPFLYHPYAGHDNNRDFVFLTQPESRALNALVSREWRPQLFLDLHQMGALGPRQFVPPFADPIAPHVHPLIWRITSHLGTAMAWELESRGKTGVISNWAFDGNWIGGTRNTGWWKNMIGVLTETASASLATPLDIDGNELRGGGKGLVEYRPQVNFPSPWPGGRWSHAEAVEYQIAVMTAFVRFAAQYRREVLDGVSAMALDAVRKGHEEEPSAWVVPSDQSDPGRARRLVELLLEAGVEGRVATTEITGESRRFPPGSVVFPAAQPLRQYLMEVLERQRYPEVSPAPGADILLPYDITAWTMPLMLDVVVERVVGPLAGETDSLNGNGTWLRPVVTGEGPVVLVGAHQHGSVPAVHAAMALGARVGRTMAAVTVGSEVLPGGSFVLEGLDGVQARTLLARAGAGGVLVPQGPGAVRPLRPVRVGVYHPYFGLMDAGWLRFVLEQAGLKVDVVDSHRVAAGRLSGSLDVLVLPPMNGSVLVDGPQQRGVVAVPPSYRRGIGQEGVEAVRVFVQEGGVVIGFQASAEWLADALGLGVDNDLKGLGRDVFHCPGALLALQVDPDHPLAWGLAPRVSGMVEGAFAFRTRPSPGGSGVRTVAVRYPDGELLHSGWIRGADHLRRRAAVVEVASGKGRVVLFAFAPYFRGQTGATMPLLLNAVINAGLGGAASAVAEP